MIATVLEKAAIPQKSAHRSRRRTIRRTQFQHFQLHQIQAIVAKLFWAAGLMVAVNPLYKIKRPAAWQKLIPVIVKLITSAIMAVPHGLLDMRAVWNTQVP
jgi:hypothetical protein